MTDWTSVATELADHGDEVRRLSAGVGDRIVSELPVLADRQLAEATRQSVADNVWLFLSMVSGGVPAESARPRLVAEEWVRLLVQRGIGSDVVGAAYRIALNGFWDVWSAMLHASLDGAELATALDESTRFMLHFIDALSKRVVEMHEAERRAWVRSGEAVRAETIRALLEQEPIDSQLAERRLGYRLDRAHRCLILWSDARAVDSPDLGGLARDLAVAQHGPRPISWRVDHSTVAIWIPGASDAIDLAAATHADVAGAVGRLLPGRDGFRWSYVEAMHARRIALLRGTAFRTVVRYEDVALQALGTEHLEHARRYVAWQLGPLAGADATSRALAETLRVYLSSDSNLRTAAARLGIHHNTVASRLHRASELLGRDPSAHAAEVLVALAILDLAREPGEASGFGEAGGAGEPGEPGGAQATGMA